MQQPRDGLLVMISNPVLLVITSVCFDLPEQAVMMNLPRKWALQWLICFRLEISVPVRTKPAVSFHVHAVIVSPRNVPEPLVPIRNKWHQHRIVPLLPDYASKRWERKKAAFVRTENNHEVMVAIHPCRTKNLRARLTTCFL